MKILAIDTSTKSGSIALSQGSELLAETFLNINVTHSETLLLSLRDMLRQCSMSMDDIELFALTIGPGSFTGVRIGVSTVKGFALSTKKPVVGVSTLEAMAWNFPFSAFPVVPFLDARRGEVYSAPFTWNKGSFERLAQDSARAPEEVLDSIDGEAILVGDGVEKYSELIQNKLGSRALMAPSSHASVRASIIASLACEKYLKGDLLDLNSFVPLYLRKSEAEINREKGLLKKG
ncbi:MAG: tRNA (adenosine(37)-N6)-threonylcarbamoyltransferase complex dimerization subunit type 1 TsaB [Deltaproteobacteria bacterium]|nr:tRNA (adenosine(37)-N6)-threonylcarbamoyltransferase complex dimerization subunit type 1 TsaB [Deltaproteobacteria bacterium]